MKIKRKYEKIGVLIERDSASRKLFYDTLSKQYDNNEDIEDHLGRISDVFIYCADEGVCIKRWDLIRDGLESLDKSRPYDNGLTYTDVTEVANVGSSRKGNAIELWMISKRADLPTRIVDIVAIENKDDKTQIIDPWDVNCWIE